MIYKICLILYIMIKIMQETKLCHQTEDFKKFLLIIYRSVKKISKNIEYFNKITNMGNILNFVSRDW